MKETARPFLCEEGRFSLSIRASEREGFVANQQLSAFFIHACNRKSG